MVGWLWHVLFTSSVKSGSDQRLPSLIHHSIVVDCCVAYCYSNYLSTKLSLPASLKSLHTVHTTTYYVLYHTTLPQHYHRRHPPHLLPLLSSSPSAHDLQTFLLFPRQCNVHNTYSTYMITLLYIPSPAQPAHVMLR